MKQIEVFTEIDAPPAVVWDVLLEFESYPEWNPFVRSIQGEPTEGKRLRVRIDPPNGREMTFEPVVVAVEENRRLAWHGQLFVPFVFDGYHEFHLEGIEGGEPSGSSAAAEDRDSPSSERTRLLNRETFRGALVPLLFDRDSLEAGFEAMNAAVAERAESRVNATA